MTPYRNLINPDVPLTPPERPDTHVSLDELEAKASETGDFILAAVSQTGEAEWHLDFHDGQKVVRWRAWRVQGGAS